MSEGTRVSDTYSKASAWPVFVALGLAISEVGIVIPLYPVAVAGLLLFVGSVSGIVHEAGYVERPWRLLGALGAVLAVAGSLVVVSQVSPTTVAALTAAVSSPDSIIVRGYAIAAAGIIALVAGGAGVYLEATSDTNQ
jgi:hypothetical protein